MLSQGAAGLQSLEEDRTVLCLCVQCLCVLSQGAAGLQSLEEDRTVLCLCPVSVYVVPGCSGPSVPRGGQDCVVSVSSVCVCCPRVQRAFSP